MLALQEAVVTTGYDQATEILGELDDEYQRAAGRGQRPVLRTDHRIDHVLVRCGRRGPTMRVSSSWNRQLATGNLR